MASGDAQPIGFVVSVPGAEVAPFSSKAVAANLEKWDLTRSSVAFRYHAMRTHARTHAPPRGRRAAGDAVIVLDVRRMRRWLSEARRARSGPNCTNSEIEAFGQAERLSRGPEAAWGDDRAWYAPRLAP